MLVESDPVRGGPYRLPGPGALLDRYRLPDLPTVPGSGRPAVRGGLTSRAPPYLGSPSPAAQANSPLTLSLLEDRGALDHAAAHIGVGRASAAAAAKGSRPWMREETP